MMRDPFPSQCHNSSFKTNTKIKSQGFNKMMMMMMKRPRLEAFKTKTTTQAFNSKLKKPRTTISAMLFTRGPSSG